MTAFEAQDLFEEGRRLFDAGELVAAEDAFLRVVNSIGDFPPACFNLGIIYKRWRNWAKCADFNERSLRFSSETGDPAWWNLGIAATALSDWETARRAWRGYGLQIDVGVGPVTADFGMAPVRINPDKDGEVIWARRLDPARARILSVPLPEGGHRWGDIVLHDGAPNGQRTANGREYSVFDELERLVPSNVPTLVAVLECAAPTDSEAVSALFDGIGSAAEDWTGSIAPLCKACSEGRPHDQHDAQAVWIALRRFGIAADLAKARLVLDQWTGGSPRTRMVVSLEMASS